MELPVYKAIKYSNDQLLAINKHCRTPVSLQTLSILTLYGCNNIISPVKKLFSHKKKTFRRKRGGRRKQRHIPIHITNKRECTTSNMTKPPGVNTHNLMFVECNDNQTEPMNQFRIGCINARSSRNKTVIIRETIKDMSIDVLCIPVMAILDRR